MIVSNALLQINNLEVKNNTGVCRCLQNTERKTDKLFVRVTTKNSLQILSAVFNKHALSNITFNGAEH